MAVIIKNAPEKIFTDQTANTKTQKTQSAALISQAIDKKAAEGEVFVIILGINKYDPNFYGEGNNLKYCVNDADAYGNFFGERKKNKSEHWKNVNIIKLTDEQATSENLKKTFAEIKEKNPALVVFIDSSHGTNDGKNPYLCLYDKLYGVDELRSDRNQYFKDAQFIMIADCCFSGGFAGAKGAGKKEGVRFWQWKNAAPGYNSTGAFLSDKKNGEKLLYKGDMVFAASEFKQMSAEHPVLGHGVYTYCFLKGAENPGYVDKKFGNGDGTASFEEVHRFTEIALPYALWALFPWAKSNQNPSMIDKDPVNDKPLIGVNETSGGKSAGSASVSATEDIFGIGKAGVTQTIGDKKEVKTGRKFVLMVGINDYISPNVNDLRGCENDVNGMEQCLGDKWKGAHVTKLLSGQATKANIRNWFLSLRGQLNANDQVLFVYSGHGTNDSKDGYLCPADTSSSKDSLISGKELATWRELLGPAVTAMIIDSCFSGRIPESFEKGKKYTGMKFMAIKGSSANFNQDYFYSKLAQGLYFDRGFTPANPTIIATASSATETSQEVPGFTVEGLQTGYYGAFMGWMMRGLGIGNNIGRADKNKDKNISLADEAFKWTYEGVTKNYKQTPKIFYSGSYLGEYYNWPIKGVDPKENSSQVNTGIVSRDPVYVEIEKTSKSKKVGEGAKAIGQGKVFVLAIGVNKYNQQSYQQNYGIAPSELKWCVNDARGVAAAFQSPLCPPENVVTLEDEWATWANVEASVEAIKQKMGPNDKLVIDFSGHGTNDGREGYICLHDTMVSGSQLGALRGKVGANEVAFIFDSCQNGALIGKGVDAKVVIGEGAKYFKYGRSNDALITAQSSMVRNLARPNTFVFTSCKGDEYSAEHPRLEHGYFTYALLQGLTWQRGDGTYHADYTQDGNMSMEELIRFTATRTWLLNKKQHPQYLDNDPGNQFVIKRLK